MPAPVTPFTRDGAVDHAAIKRLGAWLGSFKDVKGLTVLGHAGEGTFMTPGRAGRRHRKLRAVDEWSGSGDRRHHARRHQGRGGGSQARGEGRAPQAGLVYPSHGWLRFGYQKGAAQDRYRAIYEESGLAADPVPVSRRDQGDLQSRNAARDRRAAGVFAMKNGVRNMRRWDTEIPVIRRERPNLQILTCHDEYLLHTMFDVDGALVGYGGLTPEPLIELIAAGKAKDYKRAAPSTTSFCR